MKSDKLKQILNRSEKAVCGIMEREINVKKENLKPTIKTLKKSGYQIIGTSYGDSRIKKLWFIRAGGF